MTYTVLQGGSEANNTMRTGLSLLCLLLGAGASAGVFGCRPRNEIRTVRPQEEAKLESDQSALLDLAFEAASAIPLNPHIKSRSGEQREVVTACLELRQPQRAQRYIDQIGDWRRGEAYAALAFYYARHGSRTEATLHLQQASQALQQEIEDWQKDRIKTQIAQVYALLGQAQAAMSLEQGAGGAELGKVDRARAMVCPPESFDDLVRALEKLVSTKQLDAVKNAMEAYAELFNRFYADPGRRAIVERGIKASWNNLPVFVRIDLLGTLADYSLAHADRAKALELIDQAGKMLDSAVWQPQYRITLMAKLAELRFRAGDPERARADAREALDLFDAKKDEIVNIYRAQMLRPIAEAYHVMGDTAASLDLYRRAIEAGTENPNSRPRAEDLVATCCSMALHAVMPGAELWSRLREVQGALGDPW